MAGTKYKTSRHGWFMTLFYQHYLLPMICLPLISCLFPSPIDSQGISHEILASTASEAGGSWCLVMAEQLNFEWICGMKLRQVRTWKSDQRKKILMMHLGGFSLWKWGDKFGTCFSIFTHTHTHDAYLPSSHQVPLCTRLDSSIPKAGNPRCQLFPGNWVLRTIFAIDHCYPIRNT